MKVKFIFSVAICLLIQACEPKLDLPFDKFTIPAGKHYSTYKVELLQSHTLTFEAKFDETAIYTSKIEENQWDTNKLFGFSDCTDNHHDNSARFGWRWLNEQIEILAYCYVDGERIIEYVGATQPNMINKYEIQLLNDTYRFVMDTTIVDVNRSKPCDKGVYYLLFPYFGGDETAPHDVNIYIKRSY